MNLNAVADSGFINALAADLGIPAALVEKDWYIVQVLRTVSELGDLGGHIPVFGGGTSLSKGFGIIKRLSEDLDFKVSLPAATSKNAAGKGFSACRENILKALVGQELAYAEGDLLIGRNSAFFQVMLTYPRSFPMPAGFRRDLKIEMTFEPPRFAPIIKPISSFVALGRRNEPEVRGMTCVDPLEIAGDKLSAFLWRAKKSLDDAEDPGRKPRDGTLVRHLHDLVALEPWILAAPDFAAGVTTLLEQDIGRAKARNPDPASLFAEVTSSLETDAFWRSDYESFVRHVSYAADEERIDFDSALACWKRLAGQMQAATGLERGRALE